MSTPKPRPIIPLGRIRIGGVALINVKYSAQDLPAIASGSPVQVALESAFRRGKPVVAVVDADQRIVGLFDLSRFLAGRTLLERSLDAPVDGFLDHHPPLIAQGEEDTWPGDGDARAGVIVDPDGRYGGMVFRVRPGETTLCPNRVDQCFFRIGDEISRTVTYMLAVADASGTVLIANAPMMRFFKDEFEHPPFRMQLVFPLDAVGSSGPYLGREKPRIHRYRDRELLVFGFPLLLEGAVRYVAFAIHDITSLVAGELAAIREEVEICRRVIDLSVGGLQVVNQDGIITMVNRSFEEIHGIPRANAVGRHVTEVIENTRMHIVAKTGIAEIDEVQQIGNRRFVVSRIPIFQNNKCVGAVGKLVFEDITEINQLEHKVESLKKELDLLRRRGPQHSPDIKYTFADVVAVAPASAAAKDSAMRAAPQEMTVLLLGESGVGKEVFAHSIHALSTRCKGPFVRVNCSAIIETLFESELFGYVDGAFTGARKGGKQGKFEMADRGTIFLDEIGDMPLGSQAKLLRVLQEQEIEKVGGERLHKVDVRVIAATNQDLWRFVEQGTFRKDLYYRLNVIPIRIPPLRERNEDIPELVRIFWNDLKKKHGIYHKKLSAAALDLLERHEWPGNIRELRNVLERALTIVLEDTISEDQVRMIMVGAGGAETAWTDRGDCSLEHAVSQTERRAISFALARTNNNRLQAAKLLGISRALLYKKMHEYGMG